MRAVKRAYPEMDNPERLPPLPVVVAPGDVGRKLRRGRRAKSHRW